MPSHKWYEEAEKSYKEDIQDYYSKLHSALSSGAPTFARFLNLNNQKKGKLLDVGCGNGSFLKLAAKYFDVYGLDFDQKSINLAKKSGLKNVYCTSFEEFVNSHKNEKFDFVTFFEVLEHQTAPQSFISSIKQLLVPGGVIAGSVPAHNIIKPLSDGDKPPNHFIIFTKEGLRFFLESQGFKSIIVEEIFEGQALRVALGANSATLRSVFNLSEFDIANRSLKFKVYKVAKTFGRMFVPILDRCGNFIMYFLGKQNVEKIRKTSLTYRPLYFQARFD